MGVDSVFIGDSLPFDKELAILASLKTDQVTLRMKILTNNIWLREKLRQTFTARIDEARDAIRAQEGRTLLGGGAIEPYNTVERLVGSITVDNKEYGCYMGELQIIKKAQAADKRTNVVGQILRNEEFLLVFITPGRKYGFEII